MAVALLIMKPLRKVNPASLLGAKASIAQTQAVVVVVVVGVAGTTRHPRLKASARAKVEVDPGIAAAAAAHRNPESGMRKSSFSRE